jgi:hypothetical protein
MNGLGFTKVEMKERKNIMIRDTHQVNLSISAFDSTH